MKKPIITISILLPVWILIYKTLQPISDFIVNDILRMKEGEHFTESIRFFIFEVPKVLLLLILIIFFVGIIRTWFSPEKTRKALEDKSLFTGNIFAALLGVVTPFCSCSAIPLFLGFVEAGIPIGVTFSFLIAAPMINEVAIILLIGLFGWKITAIYVVTGLSIAIFSGWLIGVLKMEKYVADWVYKIQAQQNETNSKKLLIADRINSGVIAVKDIVGKVWIYIVIGIAVGAGAHGYIPDDYLSELMNKANWY